jgi:hypothetical protein
LIVAAWEQLGAVSRLPIVPTLPPTLLSSSKEIEACHLIMKGVRLY